MFTGIVLGIFIAFILLQIHNSGIRQKNEKQKQKNIQDIEELHKAEQFLNDMIKLKKEEINSHFSKSGDQIVKPFTNKGAKIC